MQIREITITGFGPLAGETLTLAPGMTVVYGPNESAKSTLHAATYAAICGMRRSRGQPRREDAQFAARFRPWSGDPWRVSAVVELADGREIELSQDLGGFNCRATDVALSRDVSSEIMFDGNPDGSRWLGFDRASFVATACVRQAEIAAVLNEAGALQDELQRAAASAGRDETAAEAIGRLRNFARENVGRDIRPSTRPLRRAIVRLEEADRAVTDAHDRHEGYLRALAGLDEREQERDAATLELRVAEATVTRGDSNLLAGRFARAEELAGKYSVEPAPATGEEELANAVAEGLALWEKAPPEPDLSGRPTGEFEAELAALPERPEGDLAAAQSVVDVDAALSAAEGLLRQHRENEPEPTLHEATSEELHDLADRLSAAPPADAEARRRVEELQAQLSRPRGAKRAPLIVAGALAAAGVVVAAVISLVLGVAVVVAAALVGVTVLWMSRRQPDTAAREAVSAAEGVLAEQEAASREVEQRRSAATMRFRELGVEPTTPAARSAAAQVAKRREWEERRTELEERRKEHADLLRQTLAARGIDADDDLHSAVAVYKQSCAEREEQNRRALGRARLEQQLHARRLAEAQGVEREGARSRLRSLAERLELGETDPERIGEALRGWQEQRSRELGEHDTARQEWRELEMLLDGRALDDLRAQVEQASRRASDLADGLEPSVLEGRETEAERARIAGIRTQAGERARAADLAKGQLEEMAKSLPSVPEAEEEQDAARAELARVRELEQTLTLAIDFLEVAQDRVHRDIAPVLCRTLEKWLPQVAVERQNGTLAQRYDEVMVDPETLQVRVRVTNGDWRDASLLSEGTKEQIYLLLRVALAEHLTTSGEKAPLLLDEITAQCDSTRRTAVLELLRELSKDRQVILFTHDEGALEWAERELDVESGADRLERRDPVPVA